MQFSTIYLKEQEKELEIRKQKLEKEKIKKEEFMKDYNNGKYHKILLEELDKIQKEAFEKVKKSGKIELNSTQLFLMETVDKLAYKIDRENHKYCNIYDIFEN